MSNAWSLVFATTIAALAACPVQAQSFSCRRADRCPERAICDSAELSRMDSVMSNLYFALRGLASRPAARALLDNQRDWLAERNSCGCDRSCLFTLYRERIDAFRGVIGPRE